MALLIDPREILPGREQTLRRGETPPRVHRMEDDEPPEQENPMPRAKKAEATATAKPKRKYTRRTPAAALADPTPTPAPEKKAGRAPRAKAAVKAGPAVQAPIFSVDSTGAVLIRRGDHGMEISREEAIALHDFMHRAEDIIVEKTEGAAA